MIRQLRRRITYANVASTLALVLALGGTSYALTLPRNSVGASQIRAQAVGSSELRSNAVLGRHIRHGSITPGDLSASTRESLRGAQGPQGPTGPTGPTGPAGPPGPTIFAALTADGTQVRFTPGITAGRTSLTPNEYSIHYLRSLDTCVATATLASVGGDTPDPGRITVSHANGDVFVRTFDETGAAVTEPFHVIVAC